MYNSQTNNNLSIEMPFKNNFFYYNSCWSPLIFHRHIAQFHVNKCNERKTLTLSRK